MLPSEKFRNLLNGRWYGHEKTMVCVGLDSEYDKIPLVFRRAGLYNALYSFNKAIIDATHQFVCAYKPNSAFYEAHYDKEGLRALEHTIAYAHDVAPDVAIIDDAKRGDIGNTNQGYVTSIFDKLKADAVTIHPYLGRTSLKPFLDRDDKGIIVLCRTSNEDAGEFQDRIVGITAEEARKWDLPPETMMPLYQLVAYRVSREWNQNHNCALVVGATYPRELEEVRKIVGDDIPILVPGIGAQGGDLEAAVRAGRDSRGSGMIINSSRGIIFASKGTDCAEAARRETIKLLDGIHTAVDGLELTGPRH